MQTTAEWLAGLTAVRPRCDAPDVTSLDGQCQYQSVKDGKCSDHREPHLGDVHTMLFREGEQDFPSAGRPSCKDGLTGEWHGGYDMGSINGRAPVTGRLVRKEAPADHRCPLRFQRNRPPRRLHPASPACWTAAERAAWLKARAAALAEKERTDWAAYARAHNRPENQPCIAWRFERGAVNVHPDTVMTPGGKTMHQITGCCEDLGA